MWKGLLLINLTIKKRLPEVNSLKFVFDSIVDMYSLDYIDSSALRY